MHVEVFVNNSPLIGEVRLLILILLFRKSRFYCYGLLHLILAVISECFLSAK